MKRGFTLLELIIVIIIIGVLATLGFAQYGRMVERARGAEARAVAGTVRTAAAAYRMEHADLTGFTNAQAGIGTANEEIPSVCRATHYFSYAVANGGAALPNQFTLTATRCIGGTGKVPSSTAAVAPDLTLTTDLALGTDVWGGSGGY